MKNPAPLAAALLLAGSLCAAPVARAGLAEDIAVIGRVQPEGKGNEDAAAAWKNLAAAPPAELPVIVRSLDSANPLARNWLRAAAGVVADRAVASKSALPAAELTALLKDTSHAGPTRVLAWDLLHKADAAAADALTMTFLDDPAAELRRPGVARLIDGAKALVSAGKKTEAVPAFQQALVHARDEDQIRAIAEPLTELGHKPDLPKHFGLLMDWQLIGPFTNVGGAGFDEVFPPEREWKPDATYDGKDGAKVKWTPFTSKDDYGKIDFNKPVGLQKGVTGYASTEFFSPGERRAELRLGCKNGWKVWLNGEFLFGRDEYHRGAMLDQYVLPVTLKKGSNRILVKCCQNEQNEQWTVEWEFQLRVCDATGTAIASAQP